MIDNLINLDDNESHRCNEMKKYSKLIGADIYKNISVDASVSGKKSIGGTSEKMVLARIKKIRSKK